jgi:hypothetical protein
MKLHMLTQGRLDANPLLIGRNGLAAAALLMSGGCIQVSAPEKPIEINLNVNVKQEVVVRLQKDAEDLITNNPELFPQ